MGKTLGWCGRKREGGYTTHGSVRTPAAAVSRPPSRSSIGAPERVMEVVTEIL